MSTIMISTPGGLVPSTRENWQRYIENKPVPIVRQKIFVGDVLNGMRAIVQDWLTDTDDLSSVPVDLGLVLADVCDVLENAGITEAHERILGEDLAAQIREVTG